MINTSRAIARRVLPSAVKRMLWYAGSAEYRRCRREVSEVLRITGGQVIAGPFAGLALAGLQDVSAIVPKLLGTFERELSPAIEDICCAQRHGVLIDVGAAEGYYSTGFARRMPRLRVVSFEAIESERRKLAQVARQNGVAARLSIRELCTPDRLADALAGAARPLVKCDIEGAELEVLDPQLVESLQRTEILVELHELRRSGVCEVIRARFAHTHEIIVFHTQPRRREDWPTTVQMPREAALQYLDEGRQSAMTWYWMKPHCVRTP
jgi:hypothetical protein